MLHTILVAEATTVNITTTTKKSLDSWNLYPGGRYSQQMKYVRNKIYLVITLLQIKVTTEIGDMKGIRVLNRNDRDVLTETWGELKRAPIPRHSSYEKNRSIHTSIYFL